MAGKRVLFTGLHPDAVDDFSQFPGLTREILTGMLHAELDKLKQAGYDAVPCWTDLGETAAAVLTQALTGSTYDCVLIGAGVRLPPKRLALFETMINIVHQYAPGARICFNTNPTDSLAAVQRWI